MKRVLSIDLDYIMEPSIEKYQLSCIFQHNNPEVRWSNFFQFSGVTSNNLDINVSNLMYCYKVFLQAIKNSKSVSFGYDHDAILFSIEGYEDIDLIHIDHHDDFLAGHFDGRTDLEYKKIIENNLVDEGNWIAWLSVKNKLKEFVWISNENSRNKTRNGFIKSVFPNYKCVTKEVFKFPTFEFDHVFVCLSPQYISPKHWHYFSMFMMAYEQITGNSSSKCWVSDKKYEMGQVYKNTNDLIKNQISDVC